MADRPAFRPGSQFAIFNRHRVDYVLIGGIAARVHGSIRQTGDVDICPAGGADNAARMADAHNELQARVYVDENTPALAVVYDAAFVAGQQTLNTITRFGRLDVIVTPEGTKGYADLMQNARVIDILGHLVPVASIEDLIRTKEATGRDKDRFMAADLRFIRKRQT